MMLRVNKLKKMESRETAILYVGSKPTSPATDKPCENVL